ncbi:nitrogen regulation protein NR(I) [Kiloniella sp. b19]|uniref:nitrogen regulation protein NR(I) n=1 Tax=Kiloniella sp. GXU_MW_B19 TaxID=3141326 RepID=UPI0031DF4491
MNSSQSIALDPTDYTILVADDDLAIRTVLGQALGRIGYNVKMASNATDLWKWVEKGDGDLVITDVVMPDENGLDLVPRIKRYRPDLRVIVMSAQNTLLTAVKATERGAFEYLSKPFDLNNLSEVIVKALEDCRTARGQAVEDLALNLGGDNAGDSSGLPLIGRSQAMQDIYRVMARLMLTDLTVMVSGESGTGKELISRALHDYGKRNKGPFVAVNMAAIPRELIESELFGHEKGAFTGATARYAGRFEQARGGTLFLDEIGDMPLEAQTRLLRVLQENEFTTVGGRVPIKADVRIITASHRDLKAMVDRGEFREDLFYRLSVVPLRLPPLRERSEDIPELVSHFMRLCVDEGLQAKAVGPEAMQILQRYPWPGNVRELENLVRRLTVLYSEDVITSEVVTAELKSVFARAKQQSEAESNPAEDGNTDNQAALLHSTLFNAESLIGGNLSETVELHLQSYFEAHEPALPASGLYDRVLCEIERPLIELCLKATGGNQIKASALLGLNRNTLRKKIKELGIQIVK